jgi:PadR family transcriptional regulator, regulatory protein PadR
MEEDCCCDMRGFLSFLVLKMISKQHMREEIRKRRGSKPSPGTVYPVVKFLVGNKLIEEIKSEGKVKKYRITKEGQNELRIATKKFVLIFCDLKGEF